MPRVTVVEGTCSWEHAWAACGNGKTRVCVCVFGQMLRMKMLHVCASNQKLVSSFSLMLCVIGKEKRESWRMTGVANWDGSLCLIALRLKRAASHKGHHFQDSASGALLLFETCEGPPLGSVLQHVGEKHQQGMKTKQIPPLKLRARWNSALCLLRCSELLTHVQHALFASIIDFLCVAGLYSV